MADLSPEVSYQLPAPEVIHQTTSRYLVKGNDDRRVRIQEKPDGKEANYVNAPFYLGTSLDREIKRIVKQKLREKNAPVQIPVLLSERVAQMEEGSDGSENPEDQEERMAVQAFYDHVDKHIPGYGKELAHRIRDGAKRSVAVSFKEIETEEYQIVDMVNDPPFVMKRATIEEFQNQLDSRELEEFAKKYQFEDVHAFITSVLENSALIENGNVVFDLSDCFLPLEEQPELLQNCSDSLKLCFQQLTTFAPFIVVKEGKIVKTNATLGSNPDKLYFLAKNEETAEIIHKAVPYLRKASLSIHKLSQEAVDAIGELINALEKGDGGLNIVEGKGIFSTTKAFDLQHILGKDLIHTIISTNLFFRGVQIRRGKKVNNNEIIHTVPYQTRILAGYMPIVDAHPGWRDKATGGLSRSDREVDVFMKEVDSPDVDVAFVKYLEDIQKKAEKENERVAFGKEIKGRYADILTRLATTAPELLSSIGKKEVDESAGNS